MLSVFPARVDLTAESESNPHPPLLQSSVPLQSAVSAAAAAATADSSVAAAAADSSVVAAAESAAASSVTASSVASVCAPLDSLTAELIRTLLRALTPPPHTTTADSADALPNTAAEFDAASRYAAAARSAVGEALRAALKALSTAQSHEIDFTLEVDAAEASLQQQESAAAASASAAAASSAAPQQPRQRQSKAPALLHDSILAPPGSHSLLSAAVLVGAWLEQEQLRTNDRERERNFRGLRKEQQTGAKSRPSKAEKAGVMGWLKKTLASGEKSDARSETEEKQPIEDATLPQLRESARRLWAELERHGREQNKARTSVPLLPSAPLILSMQYPALIGGPSLTALILIFGVDPNFCDARVGRTPLAFACSHRFYEAAKSAVNADTALHWATELLAGGADVNPISGLSLSPLHHALLGNPADLRLFLTLLKREGSDLSQQNAECQSVMQALILHGSLFRVDSTAKLEQFSEFLMSCMLQTQAGSLRADPTGDSAAAVDLRRRLAWSLIDPLPLLPAAARAAAFAADVFASSSPAAAAASASQSAYLRPDSRRQFLFEKLDGRMNLLHGFTRHDAQDWKGKIGIRPRGLQATVTRIIRPIIVEAIQSTTPLISDLVNICAEFVI